MASKKDDEYIAFTSSRSTVFGAKLQAAIAVSNAPKKIRVSKVVFLRPLEAGHTYVTNRNNTVFKHEKIKRD